MNCILPAQKAEKLCLKWQEELDSSELGKSLMLPSCGRMLGILVCTDGTVYKAFSGLLNGKNTVPGFVPPCYDTNSVSALLSEYNTLVKNSDSSTASSLSRECFEKLKTMYVFHCFDGSVRSLASVFPSAPAGTGDCCAPRLLSYCYSQDKKPLSMAEFYYGNGSLKHKEFYPPCDERCKGILKYIVGLDILYQDEDIVVVNKPHELLAIEGRTPDKQDCIASRVRALFHGCIQQPCIHRLDQATSGLMVLGKSKTAHDKLSRDFEERNVHKEYIALVEGKVFEKEGSIKLPIRLDTDNRPHQIVDFENGKPAETLFRTLGIHKYNGKYCTKLSLVPLTGRTHQLRVHCASGLGHAIVNDRLYGNVNDEDFLKLQAVKLSFNHPISGKRMCFELENEF